MNVRIQENDKNRKALKSLILSKNKHFQTFGGGKSNSAKQARFLFYLMFKNN